MHCMWYGGLGNNNLEGTELSWVQYEGSMSLQLTIYDSVDLFNLLKISKKAIEHNKEKQVLYRVHIGSKYRPDQLVFIDESACDQRTFLRKRAWALQGHQASRKQVFARGKWYTCPLALCF